MFENLRDAFREAVDNFRREVDQDDVPPIVDRLLIAMQSELAQARELVAALEKQIADAGAQITRDRDEEATCRRRAELANRVGDAETARIALKYAVRHERRRVVLERKVIALDEEHGIRVVELTEMTERAEEARSKRDTLADATGADDTLRAADDLFDELDRMASAAEGESQRRGSPMDELEREFRDLRVDPWAPIPRRELDVDAALDELKRRMKQ
ncbi:MAG: hypothetical protein EXR95_01195 [Gemmatimonadetes bacterium]|nr:hypothetical protein [Gemmatimonadota bacterium]